MLTVKKNFIAPDSRWVIRKNGSLVGEINFSREVWTTTGLRKHLSESELDKLHTLLQENE